MTFFRRHSAAVTLCAVAVVAAFWAAPAGARRVVVIKGGGWGHGIGMSQYGAYGLALKGRSARQILEKYYKGARVKGRKMPGTVRVGLAQARTSIAVDSSPFKSGGGKFLFKEKGKNKVLARGGNGSTFRVERSDTGGMRLYKNGDRVRQNGKSVFGDPKHPLVLVYEKYDSLMNIEGKSYDVAYGRLLFGTYASGGCGSNFCLRLVLSLPMQKYIYGLGEVPASWPGAVLKAQAIAGRTYVYSKIRRLGQHLSPCDCAVYDTPIDQAYIGDSKRSGSGAFWDDWKSAVDATKGKVILYRGDPIQALYSSSSGGHTEHNENVWGGTPIAYLRGVSDPADDVSANPNHTWKVQMSWGSFADRLRDAFHMGKLKRFRLVKPFGVSGRVTVVKSADRGGVRIVGADRTVRADGWDIRSVLSLKDTLFRVKVKTMIASSFTSTYEQSGGAKGPLGLPVEGSERDRRLPEDGRFQRFAGGAIFLNPHTGRSHALWGSIAKRYEKLGFARSACGYPTSSVRTMDPGLRANFEHGTIAYSRSAGVRVSCD